MRSFNFPLDIKRIMAMLDVTIFQLSELTGISRVTLTEILERKKRQYSNELLEKIYSLSFDENKGVNLNRAKELFYKDNNKDLLLFHGARGNIEGKIDVFHSSDMNDFGYGFYTGESLKQAASWVCDEKEASVYVFNIKNIDKLNVVRLNANEEWLYLILYFRLAFLDMETPKEVLELVNRVKRADLVIAPIADNEMFLTIDSFARREITLEACIHAVSVTNLGLQYVFMNNEACSYLQFVDRLYLCEKEKEFYKKERNKMLNESRELSKLAKIEYRRKGKYFDELFPTE